MRVLIAEDDVTSRAMLKALLVKQGYQVVETVDGLQAWDILRQESSPRLAILDWMMPNMDGLEVLRRVRELDTERPPYTIMLTSRDEKADIIAGLEAGADDYLSKPFDIGELSARVKVGRRIIEMQDALVKSRELLEHQATHDALTGLLNRRAILDRLQKELLRSERQKGLVVVGLCDIDHFKRINDSYGHQTGDDVLEGLARILMDTLRKYDAVGRIGGEEFVVVAPMSLEANPQAIFSRLCEHIASSPVPTRSGPLSITVSIGVASTAEGSGLDDILAAADRALYRAKNQGRNNVVSSASGELAENEGA